MEPPGGGRCQRASPECWGGRARPEGGSGALGAGPEVAGGGTPRDGSPGPLLTERPAVSRRCLRRAGGAAATDWSRRREHGSPPGLRAPGECGPRRSGFVHLRRERGGGRLPWGASSGRWSSGLCRASACGIHEPQGACAGRALLLGSCWGQVQEPALGTTCLPQARSTFPEDGLLLPWLTGWNPDTEPHRRLGLRRVRGFGGLLSGPLFLAFILFLLLLFQRKYDRQPLVKWNQLPWRLIFLRL